MKPSLLAWSLLSLLPSLVVASAADSLRNVGSRDDYRLVKRADPAGNKDSDPPSTTFNGMEVPPMKELTQDNFEETIKDGYWFVKQYSPACPYCNKIAPTWQTIYEQYYTSDPLKKVSSKSSDAQATKSFSDFYNFRFASMNCLAYGDLCKEQNVKYFPTFALYYNGQMVEQFAGSKTLNGLTEFIDQKLELIKSGTMSSDKLPKTDSSVVDSKAQPDALAAKDKDLEAGAKTGESHKDQAVQLAPKAGADKATPATPGSKAKALPNPQGISVPLTAEKFQKLVTSTKDPWFIKFFAPWCGHCQALAPTWQQMAKEMKNTLNVGEVNCDLEPRLCKDARVSSYPTMYFFRGGERVEYNGLRGLGDLISYAQKAVEVGSGVQDVDSLTLKELEEKEEVIFVYFYDHATTSEDFEALERLTLSLVGHARLVKTDSAALAERFKIFTWPRLLVVRDGRPSYYNPISPKDMRDSRQVLSWMQSVWLPIVPELTPSNAREIMNGKYVVLGILTRSRSDDFILANRELKNAALEWMDKQTQLFQLERQELRDAKQLRIEEAEDRNDQRALRAAKNMRITIREDDKKQVGFAWVDGDFWERWLRTTYGIDVANGERVIINDEDNRRYWDSSSSGASIMASRTSILETIPLVIANPPKLKPKSTVGTLEFAFFVTRSFIVDHPIVFFIFLGSFIAMVSFLARRRMARRAAGWGGILGNSGGGPGFFHLDGKEGLLNGGATGKVD